MCRLNSSLSYAWSATCAQYWAHVEQWLPGLQTARFEVANRLTQRFIFRCLGVRSHCLEFHAVVVSGAPQFLEQNRPRVRTCLGCVVELTRPITGAIVWSTLKSARAGCIRKSNQVIHGTECSAQGLRARYFVYLEQTPSIKRWATVDTNAIHGETHLQVFYQCLPMFGHVTNARLAYSILYGQFRIMSALQFAGRPRFHGGRRGALFEVLHRRPTLSIQYRPSLSPSRSKSNHASRASASIKLQITTIRLEVEPSQSYFNGVCCGFIDARARLWIAPHRALYVGNQVDHSPCLCPRRARQVQLVFCSRVARPRCRSASDTFGTRD